MKLWRQDVLVKRTQKPTQGKRDSRIRISTVWFKDEPFLSTMLKDQYQIKELSMFAHETVLFGILSALMLVNLTAPYLYQRRVSAKARAKR